MPRNDSDWLRSLRLPRRRITLKILTCSSHSPQKKRFRVLTTDLLILKEQVVKCLKSNERSAILTTKRGPIIHQKFATDPRVARRDEDDGFECHSTIHPE